MSDSKSVGGGSKPSLCATLKIKNMFYEHDNAKEIYSKYLNGMDVDSIACYMAIEKEWDEITLGSINEVIDFMNSLYF